MSKYIRKLFFFITFVVIVIVLITTINKILLTTINPFKICGNKNILILGDSHSKYALNDKILLTARNFSNDADSYFYTYIKVKKIIEVNPHIDTVLISFSSHNINYMIENRWLLNKEHLKSRLRLYFPLLENQDFIFLFRVAPKELISSIFSQILFPFYIIDEQAFGSYEDLHHNILTSEIRKIKNNINKQDTVFNEAINEIRYLREAINICRSHNKVVILINTPLHKYINNDQDFLYKCYNKYFSDVLFYDFSKIELKDECFGDLVHLSSVGADYFSKLIKEKNIFNANTRLDHYVLYK